MRRGRAFPPLPDPRFAGPLGQRSGAPFHCKELQRSHVPQKRRNPLCSEPTKKMKVKRRKKSLWIMILNSKMSDQLPDLGFKIHRQLSIQGVLRFHDHLADLAGGAAPPFPAGDIMRMFFHQGRRGRNANGEPAAQHYR